ncbi:MAG: arsenate reductase ArsC [Longimonas sp.]|uniref:arsenate reductase ArsC n=1 Tax=Longimonas sp. TaxID=2039626 RepID=UPI00397629E5
MATPSVLFICTHNSARSQMAEGLLRDRYGDDYDVYSAGTEQTHVRPLAIQAMDELGIDISGHTSKTIDDVAEGRTFDYVVTVCNSARENCPYLPAQEQNMHQSFDDPSAATGSEEEQLAVFRRVRDEIGDWIEGTFAPEKKSAA